ncbi:hypothetical protein ACA910_011688 [Epithemia clementina (nom. ined.)]
MVSSSSSHHPCACQPGQYEFTLDFSHRMDCADTSLVHDETGLPRVGIRSMDCQYYSSGQNGPASGMTVVDFVQIRESDSQYNWINHQDPNVEGPFWNGQSFSYLSVLPDIVQKGHVASTVTTSGSGGGGRKPSKSKAVNSDSGGGGGATGEFTTLPSAINVHLFGKTKFQELCEFDFTIYFSNDCAVFPVIKRGDYIGPVTVTSVSDPPHAICPLVVSHN